MLTRRRRRELHAEKRHLTDLIARLDQALTNAAPEDADQLGTARHTAQQRLTTIVDILEHG